MITAQPTNHCAQQFHIVNDAPERAEWHVIWTRSNYESSVYQQLIARGYQVLFATMDQWSRGKNGNRLIRVPMFRSYLFIHHAIGKYDYIDVCNTKGVVRLLGNGWDKLATIPETEIMQIQSVCNSDVTVNCYPYIKTGDKVRVIRGSLKNTEGILIRNKLDSGLLVLSINMLNRSVAVEINCTDVVPAC